MSVKPECGQGYCLRHSAPLAGVFQSSRDNMSDARKDGSAACCVGEDSMHHTQTKRNIRVSDEVGGKQGPLVLVREL